MFFLKVIEKCKSVGAIFIFEWAENKGLSFAFKEHYK